MDALFHFIFPLMAALAARIHMKHGVIAVVTMAASAVLIDIDHFMGPGLGGAMFHNLFFTLCVPFTILSIMYTWGGEIERQASICLLLFLFSHTILDLFSEGTVALFYPITNMQFGINANLWIGRLPGDIRERDRASHILFPPARVLLPAGDRQVHGQVLKEGGLCKWYKSAFKLADGRKVILQKYFNITFKLNVGWLYGPAEVL